MIYTGRREKGSGLCPRALASLGVVPVFVNTGAALLPAIVAGLASVVGLILRPRELARLCIRRPYVPLLVAAVGVGGYFGIAWLLRPAETQARRGRSAAAAPAGATDWAAVGLEIIRQQRDGWQQAWLEERNKRLALEKELAELKPRLERQPGDAAGGPEQQDSQRESPQAVIFRGDASRSGYAGGGAPLKLKPLWELAEPFTMYLASPTVVGEAVYGASCQLDPPDNYGSVFCLDARTGKPRWQTAMFTDAKTGQERELKAFFSSPTISADGKSLVIGQGLHFDTGCALLCLDTADGKVRWRVETPLHIEGSPAIEGDVAVAGAGAVEGDDLKPLGDPGYVLAVRISDGKLLWTHPVNDPESSPAVRDGVAYIGSGVGGSAVVALRLETDEELDEQGLKRELWKTATPYPATGTVTLAGDLVLVGCGNANYVLMSSDPKGAVVALDRRSGAVRWKRELDGSVLGPIATADGKAICPVLGGRVVAIDLERSGKVLWEATLGQGALVKAGTALAARYVYAVTHDGYLVVLDAADGAELERHYLNAPSQPGEMGLSTSSPFVSGGRVYVGSETGGLRCFAGGEVD